MTQATIAAAPAKTTSNAPKWNAMLDTEAQFKPPVVPLNLECYHKLDRKAFGYPLSTKSWY